MDRVNLAYTIMTIAAVYNFIVFGILWYKEKYIPTLYAYITFLVFGIGVSRGIELYSRILRTADPESGLWFLDSNIWFQKLWIEAICLLLVCIHITWVLLSWNETTNKERRR